MPRMKITPESAASAASSRRSQALSCSVMQTAPIPIFAARATRSLSDRFESALPRLVCKLRSTVKEGPPRWPLPAAAMAGRLLRQRVAQRDLFDVIADLDLVDYRHPFDHAAEQRVLAVEKRRRGQADVELAAAGFAFRVDRIAGPRHRDGAAQMMLGGADLGRDFVARTAHPGALRVAALDHEAGLHAME